MSSPAKECFPEESQIPDSAIDLPDAPIVIANEPSDLKNSEIETHFMDGSIVYSKLISLDQNVQLLRYIDLSNLQEKQVEFSKLKFILFNRELEYKYENHPTATQIESTDIPEKPQSFSINFNDKNNLSGDTAITVLFL